MNGEAEPVGRATSEPPPTNPPPQFTLRYLFGWTTWLAGLCGLAAWAGQVGLFHPYDAYVLALLAYVFVSLVIVAIVSAKWRLTAIICGGVALGLVCSGLLIPRRSAAREPARRANCISNLKQIAWALHSYHDRHGRFPPAVVTDAEGKPMHSWRTLILPYLEGGNIYKQYRFDEPWDGPNNRALAAIAFGPFRCPSDDTSPIQMTSYVAITGSGTAWANPQGTKLSDIKDGAANTILVVEIANSNIHWMEPRDLDIGRIAMQVNPKNAVGISSRHPGGANVAWADCTCHFLDDATTATLLRAWLTANGGENVTQP